MRMDGAKLRRWREQSRRNNYLKDKKRQEVSGGGKEKGERRERELAGCGLPGSDFHILPIATPKSLILWPQTKYC